MKTCSVTETQSLGMTTTLAGGHEDPEEASHKPRHQPRPAHVLCAQQGSQHFTRQLHNPQSSPGVGNAHPPHPTCGRHARRAARGGTRAETSVSAQQPAETPPQTPPAPLSRSEQAGRRRRQHHTEGLGSPPSHGPPDLPTRLQTGLTPDALLQIPTAELRAALLGSPQRGSSLSPTSLLLPSVS